MPDPAMVAAARAAAETVVVDPRHVRFGAVGWRGDEAALASLAETVAARAAAAPLALADLKTTAGQDALRRLAQSAYAERLHDGVAAAQPTAVGELRLLVERAVRWAKTPIARDAAQAERPNIFHELDATLLRMCKGDAAAAADELDAFVSKLFLYWLARIQAGKVTTPASLAWQVRRNADQRVSDALPFYKRRCFVSLDQPLPGADDEASRQALGDALPDERVDRDPERAATRADRRERWLADLCGLVLDGSLLPMDFVILLLIGFGAPSDAAAEVPSAANPEESENRQIAAALQRWRAEPGGVAAYFADRVGLAAVDAARVASRLAPQLATMPDPVTAGWVRQRRFRARERFFRLPPEFLARFKELLRERLADEGVELAPPEKPATDADRASSPPSSNPRPSLESLP